MEQKVHKTPEQALVVKRRWATKILAAQKTWEIRGSPLRKRGRFALAVSGESLLAGEVTFTDSFAVGIWQEGGWRPISNREEDLKNFLLRPENLEKHQTEPSSIPYQIAYAWVMEDSQAYNPERTYCPSPGPLWQWLHPCNKPQAELAESTQTSRPAPRQRCNTEARRRSRSPAETAGKD